MKLYKNNIVSEQMLLSYYGIDTRTFSIRGVNRTHTFKRSKQLLKSMSLLRNSERTENKASQTEDESLMDNGGQLYKEVNKIRLSQFMRETRASFLIDRCFFGFMGVKY